MHIIVKHCLEAVSGGADPKPSVNPAPSMPSGQIAVGPFNISPNIAGNEHGAAGNFLITTPISDNVSIYASTTVSTDYHNFHNNSNNVGVTIKFA